MSRFYLTIKWSVSRGRETYGYNICTAQVTRSYDPTSNGVIDAGKWSTKGGGYDMLGTVVGEFLQDRYQHRLRDISKRAATEYDVDNVVRRNDDSDRLYGMYRYASGVCHRVTLDGGCGIREMERVAVAIGVQLTATLDRKGHVTGYMVDDASTIWATI